MKKHITSIPILIFLFISQLAFSQSTKYTIDVQNSEVEWTGYHLGKAYEHWGTLKTKSGSITVENESITAGELVIDMSSLDNTDITNPSDKEKLVQHLKSADFFDVEKFSEAFLVIKKSEKTSKGNLKITADMQVKGIAKEIQFEAEYAPTFDGGIKFSAELTFNRLDHKVMFPLEVEDALIDKEIKLDVLIIAKPSGKLSVDIANSEVEWTGYHLGKAYEHWGTLKAKSGFISFENDNIISGELFLDMNSLDNTDITNPNDKEKLVQHLKSADFFDVQKYPEASLIIKKSEKTSKGNLKITATMTIKGITKEIQFEAAFASTYDNSIKFSTELTFNRLDHKVMFPLEVEDAMIDKEIKLDVLLICK